MENGMPVNLKRLLWIHAVVTLLAGMLLIVSPASIPSTVNISIRSDQNLLCYFLGTAEIAMAYLSFMSRRLSDIKALRLVCITFILFHGLTALAELLAYTEGVDAKILMNVLLRVIILVLFVGLGIRVLRTASS